MAALTGVAATGAAGTLTATRGLSGVAATGAVGSMTTRVVGNLAFTLPVLRIAATGIVAVAGNLRFTLPAMQLRSIGVTAVAGNLALRMPTLRLQLTGGNALKLALPMLQLQLTGATAVLGVAAFRLPSVRFAGTGTAANAGTLAFVPPPLVLSMSGATAASGRMALTLRALALAMQGHSGTVGSLVLRLPVIQLDLIGNQTVLGALQLHMPALHLRLTSSRAAASSTATTLAMHTERQSLTQYSNFPFNSYAAFNGVYLGASDDGLFALTGVDDDGTAIQAVARLGITDFGTSHLKRIDRVYVGYRASGPMVLRVITDETQTRDYRIAAPADFGLRGGHVRLGRGVQARYWQLEVRNQDGADFTLDTIEVKPTKLRRRVGGGDA